MVTRGFKNGTSCLKPDTNFPTCSFSPSLEEAGVGWLEELEDDGRPADGFGAGAALLGAGVYRK